jgi:hypothetical protein
MGRLVMLALGGPALAVAAFMAQRSELFVPMAPPPPEALLARAHELAGPGYDCLPADPVRQEEREVSDTWLACLSATDEPDLVLGWGRLQNDFHAQGLGIWLRIENLEESPQWNL